jgi:hypothetical protein
MSVRDPDVRKILCRELENERNGDPSCVVVEEFGLCQHSARVDVLVVNGTLHGYEIKSEVDNLDRLPDQQSVYNKILDRVTVVAADAHLRQLLALVPPWWGVWRVDAKGGGAEIEKVRLEAQNPSIDPHSLVQLLWRDEAIALARECALDSRLLRKPRSIIWDELAKVLSVDDLRLRVRDAIKKRFASRWIVRSQSRGG